MTTYRFTEEDHANAEREGYIRQINSFWQKSHAEYGEYDHRDGLYGEIAFSVWSGLERTVAEQGVLSDGGVDFTDGPVTIDVKATAARGTWPVGRAHLLRPKGTKLRADVFALIVLQPDRSAARFAGWATQNEIGSAEVRQATDTRRPRVYIPTRVLPEGELHTEWRGWST